tara:strand:+ start:7969 stop:8679 length:711 start_codon:yes stop_codon:yes gene_type:complete
MARQRKAKSKNYFTAETEKYIVLYNNTLDTDVKNEIFREHIYYPFYKLVENIIHTFKFYYTDVNEIEDLKLHLLSILVDEKISKFDPTNGAKAYSYFGTIVKRWLINYNNQNYKRIKQIGSFNDMEDYYIDIKDPVVSNGITLSSFIDNWVEEMYLVLNDKFSKESEKKIADAVLTVFKERNSIEIFKKKALYIYIREMTDCDTPHLTKVISRLKKDFYKKLQVLHDKGLLVTKKV